MKKDIFKSVMLALCMLVSFYANAHGFEVDGIYYNILTTTEVEVTFKGSYSSEFSEYKGKVEIPESISYDGSTYSVTSIGYSAFYYSSGLTSITIPNSVTSIGNSAFYGCSGLTCITIPNSVTSIGTWAFYGCKGLKNVINCSSLDISAGSSLHGYVAYYADKVITDDEQIGDFIFKDMELVAYTGNDKDVKLPDNYYGGNYTIGEFAFKGCTGLTSITIPNSVTSIGYSAFEGCKGLTSITIPNSVTSIGTCAFYGCEGLKTVINCSSLDISAGSSLHGY
ncbi:MAG: leucine-rich repeat domain-containing protein, partial [Bacteroidales bacterium]|nr:leucine-rich repeat domain-containing protein [Bacteroidales bacterium]